MLLVLAFAAGPAVARDLDAAQPIVVADNDGMTLSEAVESVRQRTKGRIISAETKGKNGNEVHHIKVLTDDGKVKTFKIQGRKGGRG